MRWKVKYSRDDCCWLVRTSAGTIYKRCDNFSTAVGHIVTACEAIQYESSTSVIREIMRERMERRLAELDVERHKRRAK